MKGLNGIITLFGKNEKAASVSNKQKKFKKAWLKKNYKTNFGWVFKKIKGNFSKEPQHNISDDQTARQGD
jgi:hypothetical protein